MDNLFDPITQARAAGAAAGDSPLSNTPDRKPAHGRPSVVIWPSGVKV